MNSRNRNRKLEMCWTNINNYKQVVAAKGRVLEVYWNDFDEFYEWAMANGWQDGLWLTRMDKTQGFTPENCQWLPPYSEVRLPVHSFVKYFYHGRPAIRVAEENGISFRTFRSRIYRGWDIERAVTQPAR